VSTIWKNVTDLLPFRFAEPIKAKASTSLPDRVGIQPARLLLHT
jgi:hypothetical protein